MNAKIKFKNFLIVFILVFNIVFFFSSYTIKNNENMILIMKNHKLKTENNKLLKRVVNVENKLDSIYDYDDYINNQILGMSDTLNSDNYGDIDTCFVNMSLYQKINFVDSIVSTKLNHFKDLKKFTDDNDFLFDNYPNISPTKKMINLKSSNSKFGLRMHPILNRLLFHKGIDISLPYGSNIYSTMDGFVKEIRRSKDGYGNLIIIDNVKYQTRYAHLSSAIFIKEGDYVMKGQLIAKSGNSGLSTSPHLHYEIRQENIIQNPIIYIFDNYVVK